MAGGAGRPSTDVEGSGARETDVRQFAVVNASELLERLAYYGVLSVTGLFLLAEGYSSATVGVLFAVLLPLPYVVPLIAAPLAARLGYRPVMLASFVGYAAGFLLIFLAAPLDETVGFLVILGGIVLVGAGAGLFKPLTAAAIGLVTSAKHRNAGYTWYYVGINVGGFVGPLLMGAFGEYRIAYLVGAATIAVDFLLVLALFRNPLPPKPGLKLLESVRPFREVFTNARFVGLLLIFSGFFFVYSMALTFIIPYLQDFVARPEWFRPSWQVSLAALCVIVLGLPLGAAANRVEAVRTMALGIVLLVAGFLLVGFSTHIIAFVSGIVLVAAGEVLAYPGFLSYVSRIAPPDRIAVYQGVGFLPLFVGFLTGPLAGGLLYESLVDQGNRPTLFWAIMASVGIVALAALLVYAKAIRPKDAGPAPRWQGKPAALLVTVLGAVAIVVAAAADPLPELAPSGEPIEDLPAGTLLAAQDGNAGEGDTVEVPLTIPAGAGNVTFTLEWSDEPTNSPLPGATNQPDTFDVEVIDRFGTRVGQAEGSSGTATLVASFSGGASDIRVRITLTSAGDTVFLGQTAAADTGNGWTLTVTTAP